MIKETDGLEPQQYQRQYWEDDVPLQDVRKSALRKFVYLGVLLFLLLVMAGALIKFPDEVQLPFVFKTDKSEEIYRFPFPVYVMEKYIAPGSSVKKGARLLRISAPEIVALISRYNDALQKLENYNMQKTLSEQKQKEILNIKIQTAKMKIARLQNEMEIADSVWKSNEARLQFEKEDAESKLAQNKQLHAGKYISQQELKQYEARKIAATDVGITAKQNYEKEKNGLYSLGRQYSLDIASLSQELNKLASDTRYDSVALNNQVLLARSNISNSFGDFEVADGALVIKSNADEVVSYLFEGDKEVGSGNILLKMRYCNTPLYSVIISPPSLVGKLQNRQQVYLKVATFPSYEWGAASGHIENISLTNDENGNFNVRIALDDLKKMAKRIQPGMNGSATIVLSERTFFGYFFRNIKKTYYQVIQKS